MSFRGITRYGGVRSPYLSRPSAKKEYMIDYARLDGGLNLWDLDYRMGRNESPEMENLWWRDGVLCCRDGQNACDGVDEDGKKAGPGVGYAASNGQFHGMEFFHIGACIYYGDPSQEDMTLVKLCEGIPEVRGTFFQYDGALYYKTKGCFKKITKEETFAAADVAGYVPVIVLNADPATGSGDLYQPENRLADGKTVWYNAKESVKEYHLPVQDVAAVTKVEVDGAEKTVETDYTVDLEKGTVTFTSAPPVTNPPTNNTVKITYTKENTAAKKAVMDCRYAIVYGGGNSVVLVLAGSEEQPNAYFWNGNHTVMDAAYFPISQYNLAGDRAEAVTGFGVQSGFLMIFKEHSVGRAELSTSEIDGRAYLTLNYTNVNSETGCDLPWTIRLVENNLVFCNREQGVHIVKSTTPALENNIESISRNVNGTAERRGLLYDVRKAGDVCTCNDGDRYWLAANGHVYVWDYVLSSASKPSWFYFTNIRAAAFFLADETVHHLSPSGRVTRMERTYADFNGPIDKVYRFATQHFGSYDRLKDVRRVVFQTRSDTDTKIRITYKSDYETRRDLTDIESFSWRLCPRDLTHRYLGVPQFALAAVRKPGCRHVRHFTMTLENHEAFRDMSLVGAQIYYNYQGRDR